MTASIDTKRLAELRTAAEVGIRMSSMHPHTVQVRPDELAALVEEVHCLRAERDEHEKQLAASSRLLIDQRDEARGEVTRLRAHLEREQVALRAEQDARADLRVQVDRLRAELAEQFPVAMAARAATEEGREPDVAIAEVRNVIRDIGNSTAAAKLEYLPTRLRGGQ